MLNKLDEKSYLQIIEEKDLIIKSLEEKLEKAQQPTISYDKLTSIEFIQKTYCNQYFPITILIMYFCKTSLYFWTDYTGINTKNF